MWRYLLLGMPIFSLVLFFVWSFEVAFVAYTILVLLSLGIYFMTHLTQRLMNNQRKSYTPHASFRSRLA